MNIYDNIINYQENLKIFRALIEHRSFFYGESDRFDTPVTGMVYDLDTTKEDDKNLIEKMKNVIFSFQPELKNLTLYRNYVNLFLPNENPFFHVDGDGITCLFYFNPEHNLDEGGETQFFIDDQIIGVLPKPGRLVIFDGQILHRATCFRKNPRITVALKFHR